MSFRAGDTALCTTPGRYNLTEGKAYLVHAVEIIGTVNHVHVFDDLGIKQTPWASRFKWATSAATARSTDPATSKGERKVNKYEQTVLAYLASYPAGLVGKEIAGMSDTPLNCITPRFAPLRRKGLIKAATKFVKGATVGYEGARFEVVKRDKQIVWVLA